MHDLNSRKKLLNRLRRVNGQIEAVSRMIEDDATCVEIVMQISAATGGLSKVAKLLLADHVRGTLTGAANSDASERDAMLEELIDLFEKYAQTK